MRNDTGTLLTFLEDVFALRGFGASNRSFDTTANDDLADIARMRAQRAALKQAGEAGAANENKTSGLSPLVSVAVSVCPVPPVAKQA